MNDSLPDLATARTSMVVSIIRVYYNNSFVCTRIVAYVIKVTNATGEVLDERRSSRRTRGGNNKVGS
jgi:hypothetical protein